jgi:hypothetical protein
MEDMYDFFVGHSSILRLRNGQRLRVACTAAAANVEVVLHTLRSRQLPAADQPQVTHIGNVTWNVSEAAFDLLLFRDWEGGGKHNMYMCLS